jgi:hypothetical protein
MNKTAAQPNVLVDKQNRCSLHTKAQKVGVMTEKAKVTIQEARRILDTEVIDKPDEYVRQRLDLAYKQAQILHVIAMITITKGKHNESSNIRTDCVRNAGTKRL